MTFRCKATKGELDFGSEYNQNRLKLFLQDNEGKELTLTLPKVKRSGSQNSFYWAYLTIVERDTGNNAEDLHEFFKSTLSPKKIVTVKGKKEHEVVVAKSTTEMSKAEFGEYLYKIAAMTEVPLLDPADAGYILN
jgi:hypothetical protein